MRGIYMYYLALSVQKTVTNKIQIITDTYLHFRKVSQTAETYSVPSYHVLDCNANDIIT